MSQWGFIESYYTDQNAPEANREMAGYFKIPEDEYTTLDGCIKLVDNVFPVNSLTLIRDPSGMSANLVVWPFGLADAFYDFRYASYDLVLSVLTVVANLYDQTAPIVMERTLNK